MRKPGAGVGTLLLAPLLVAGCSLLPPPAGIQLTLPAREEWRALPVTVVDHAAIVRNAAPAERPNDLTGATGVEPVPGRDDAVMITWLGGECDDRSIVTVDPAGARYQVSVQSPSSAMSCSAVGIIRTIVLELAQPVGAGAFDMPALPGH